MVFAFQPDDEFQDALRKAYDQNMMVTETLVREMFTTLKELEPDALANLRMIFNRIGTADMESAQQIAAYYEGQISAILIAVHGRCAGCGGDHLAEMLEEETAKAACEEEEK